ncbi:MAG TPA: AAA family ATPase [Miltoncostaea sp.]|nr:AAA family ATPase [Miltoncostaea sp.]
MSVASTSRNDALVERDRLLEQIGDVVSRAARGEARMLLIEGQAGIGKSRLAAEARRNAADAGMTVLTARGSELEREFPYGVVRQLFEGTLVDPDARKRLLAGAAAAAAPLFGPEPEGGDDARDAAFTTLHGLYWLVLNLAADAPVAILVDDLHWCDRPSLRFIAFLLNRLEGNAVLVVGSTRPEEPGADLALLADLERDPLTLALSPTPLSAAGSARLIEARLGRAADPAFADASHVATGGNPLLLTELLRAVENEGIAPEARNARAIEDLGPRAVRRAVLVRLARLPAEAVAVAEAVAMLGDGAEVRHVARLAGLEEDTAARGLGVLARAEILRPEPPIGFVHPLVRDAIYRDIPPGERERRHTLAAGILREGGASRDAVAAHLLEMPPTGEAWVADEMEHAARTALVKGAGDSAATYLRRCLDEPLDDDRRARLLGQLGLVEGFTDGQASAESLREAFHITADPTAKARLGILLANTLIFTNHIPEALAVADEGAALVRDRDHDLAQRFEAVRLGVAFFDTSLVPLDDELFAPYRGELTGDGPGARALAALAAYQWAMKNGPSNACADLALRAIRDGILLEAENGGLAHGGAFFVLVMADRDEVMPFMDASFEAAKRSGSLWARSAYLAFGGIARSLRGQLEDAIRMMGENREIHEVWGEASVEPILHAHYAHALMNQGDIPAAREVLDAVGLGPALPPGNSILAWYAASRMRLLFETGADEELLAYSELCEERFADLTPNPAWIPWRSLRAKALDRMGRTPEALELAAEELEQARGWGSPRVVGSAMRIHGALQRADGVGELEEAVRILEGTTARLEHARALASLGTALRLARRPTEARDPLARALELATSAGAAPLAERARAELAAAGGRPRASALKGVAALTASERRVADLAAEGQTNKDIAQALYVTPKTVEVHLSNSYRKLGIRSRRELVEALAS